MIIKRLFKILTRKEKRILYVLLFLSLFVALIEAAGVASIAPFVAIVSNPDIIFENKYLYLVYDFYQFKDKKSFLIFSGLLVLSITLTSVILKTINTYSYLKFTRMSEHYIGKRLTELYINQNYIWFVNKNTSELDAKILKEIHNLIYHVIEPIILLFGHIFVVIMIVGILLIAKPIISISLIAFLGIVYFTLFSSLKEMIKNAGKERVIANEKRFHSLRDLFGSIKEIKSSGKEKYFLEYFSSSSKKHASIESKLQLVAHLPRYLIEAIAFGSMIIIVILLILNGYNFATIAPTLTLFALASYRILPAMQQIHYALSHLRYSGNLMQRLEEDLSSLEKAIYKPKNDEKLVFNNKIILNNINYRYPSAKLKALKNIF